MKVKIKDKFENSSQYDEYLGRMLEVERSLEDGGYYYNDDSIPFSIIDFIIDESLEYKIKTMEAYRKGKKIMMYNYGFNEVCEEKDPEWAWDEFYYFVKPEPKYRPFTWKERFQVLGKNIILKNNEKGWVIQAFYKDLDGKPYFETSAEDINFYDLLTYYVFVDEKGNETPCGVEVKE